MRLRLNAAGHEILRSWHALPVLLRNTIFGAVVVANLAVAVAVGLELLEVDWFGTVEEAPAAAESGPAAEMESGQVLLPTF